MADSGITKVLHHTDGKDPDVAKYAMALIPKHIEAEGRLNKTDGALIVPGPALKLFEKETVFPDLRNNLNIIIDKGTQAEIAMYP